MEKKVYFLTPYISRDLPGNVLIGQYLERKYNIQCYYLNGYNVYNKIRDGGFCAIIFDHLQWKFKAEQLRYAKKMGLKTIVLPTEGLSWDEDAVINRLGVSYDVSRYLDLQFSWGTYVDGIIKKKDLLKDTCLSLTGSQRFDFYSKQFLSVMGSKEDFIERNGLKQNQPIILWATNTTMLGSNEIVKRSRKKYKHNGTFSKKFVEDLIADQKQQFKDQYDVFERLVNANPNWNFVIKVHPAEQIHPYEELASRYPDRLYLLYNTPIFDVLVFSDILFQRNCTTATEAWMLKKPVLQTEFSDYPRNAHEIFKSGSYVVRNFTETQEAIEFYLNGGEFTPNILSAREEFISRFYYKIDGYSHMRIADEIASLLSDENLTQNDISIILENLSRDKSKYIKSQNSRFSNMVKDFLGVDRKKSFRFWKSGWSGNEKSDGEREATNDEIEFWRNKFEQIDLA